MTKETSLKSSSAVNLPVGSIETIINVEDRRFDVPVDDVVKELKKKDVEFVKTFYTTVDAPPAPMIEDKDGVKKKNNNYYCPPEYITITDDCAYITSIEQKQITNQAVVNPAEAVKEDKLKFYKLFVEFADGNKKYLILPSYVKFYSSHKGNFIPIEYIHSRDILMDYSKRMVKTEDAIEVKDYEIPTNYWNIKVTYEKPTPDYKGVNFYIDGILANVSYFNFNDTGKEDQEEEKVVVEPLATESDYTKPVETNSNDVGANAFATAFSEAFK